MKTGKIQTRSGTEFIFRIHEPDEIHLYPIQSDPMRGVCQKCKKMPKGTIEYFCIDHPPRTVSFQPILSPFT